MSHRPAALAASILAADFWQLGHQISEALDAGVDRIHVDVMDGHFVPDISIGLPVVRSIRAHADIPIEVHLMVSEPQRHVERFVEAGASVVIVHQEGCHHLDRTLRRIRELGASAGVAINPATPVSVLEEVLDLADLVLVMTVNPGYAGQRLLEHTLRKAAALAARKTQHRHGFELEVDGGINEKTIASAHAAGADVLVAASAIFRADRSVGEAVRALRAQLTR